MASAAEWIEGARLRTLPAAISPVLAGAAIAVAESGFSVVRTLLALLVALALQVGVNYANDYSDGVRGTDAARVGPQRLVGSGAARPGQVKYAAFGCFGLAGIFGLILIVLCGQWWLLAVGVACVLAAWYYTGGKHPYGYLGLGEVFVFVFFGLVATAGTAYVQIGRAPWTAWTAAVAMGALACAVLVCNNLRDLENDLVSGKRTLETRLGDRGSRVFYVLLGVVAIAMVVVTAAGTTWWALAGLAMVVFLVPASRQIVNGGRGMALVRTLKFTGFAELAGGTGLFLGMLIGV
ncbi:1,4-dihydroxy-2-naphthoate polyprenyltransferase [Propionimicrobium sp. PCR01-08-3]|uniref:1,4-dihydroxy-2-naphthoate polyprenyltransferase n=1 Tax=Propionimicrobium sp. PCR01-08-3 TaxID=3052086 RepID=UPI00255C6545|nr:1,4-dihydroxy-2-naphthoate polyprenyltransferase [Propionimicrobium sp. PCR01-08-3]WIY83112.1 1,4-dihydroxy-2-naphthoate polyprenyltransferase [Propionimicrobium sp. PCR01-08-3]